MIAPWCSSVRRQSLLHRRREPLDELRQLGIGCVERRRENDRIARAPADMTGARIADQAVLEGAAADLVTHRPFGWERLRTRPIADQLNADEITSPAHVSHFIKTLQRVLQLALEPRAIRANSWQQRIALDNALHRQPGGTRGRMS